MLNTIDFFFYTVSPFVLLNLDGILTGIVSLLLFDMIYPFINEYFPQMI